MLFHLPDFLQSHLPDSIFNTKDFAVGTWQQDPLLVRPVSCDTLFEDELGYLYLVVESSLCPSTL